VVLTMSEFGRAVQESLLTDAARISSVSVLNSQQTPTTDIATARQLARDFPDNRELTRFLNAHQGAK